MKKENRLIFLKGRKVILRPLRKETDLESALRWINDPEVTQYLSMFLPQSIVQESEWFDNLLKRQNDIILAIETLKGIFIGITGLHQINWKDRTVTHGVFIGEKEYWGKGYGTDANMALLNYAFNSLNLRKVCSSVISFNKRSLRYHLACGYKIVGKNRRQIFKNGRYYSMILLEVFKKDWQEIWQEYTKSRGGKNED